LLRHVVWYKFADVSEVLTEGSKHLWNVGKLLPYYTAQQTRRHPSLYSPPWKPEIPPRLDRLWSKFYYRLHLSSPDTFKCSITYNRWPPGALFIISGPSFAMTINNSKKVDLLGTAASGKCSW
jgi:hypothetical protein